MWRSFLLFGLVACSRVAPSVVQEAGGAPSAVATVAAFSTNAVVEPLPVVARGTATLVLQKVFTDCGGGAPIHLLGTDVLVVLQSDQPAEKPTKEFAFCPSKSDDGGQQKPSLQIWENCRAYPACQIVASDGGDGRVEVQCGKEHVTLERDATHTVIRGSFGVREVAPFPMHIAPVRSEVRSAFVDC